MPAHGDAALLRIIEARQQAANGGLAAARGADNGGRGLFRNGEGYVAEHLTGIIAKAHMAELNVIVLQRNILAARVDQVLATQRIQLIHRVVDYAQRMRAVADGLKAGKDAEGEEDEHQRHGKVHPPVQAHQAGRQRQAHAAALERQRNLNHNALPDPAGIKGCAALLRIDQQAHRVGRHHQRHGRKDVRKERKHKPGVPPSFQFAAPVDDALHRFEHALRLLFRGRNRPVLRADVRLPHILIQRAIGQQLLLHGAGFSRRAAGI